MTIPRELEDLFASAAQRIRKDEEVKVLRAKNAKPEPVKPVKVSERYLLPENWRPGRAIALIHADTKTLLGNFREFNHKTERGARKLERLSEPVVVTAVEYVHGKHWITEDRPIPSPERWTAEREVILPLAVLPEFGLSAEAVGLKVCLSFGGIARAELCDHTQFFSPDNRTLQTFPAGTNLLEVLSLESKIELRKELQ